VAERPERGGRSETLRARLRHACELLILAMAVFSPWAIGAVDAWAQLILDSSLIVLVILGLATAPRRDWARRLLCMPSLALGGLGLLALVQALPLPSAVERTIAPATYAWRAGLAPAVPQSVAGDSSPAVRPPAPTLSHDPDASLRTAAQLAASWLLFQAVLGLGRGAGSLRLFGLVTVANASLMTLFSIVQALTWSGKIYGIRAVTERVGWLTGGPFVCHNHLAAYLNLAFGMALGFFLVTIQEFPRGGKKRRRSERHSAVLLAGYAAGVIAAGIVLSNSRGGFLAMLISTVVTILILRPGSIRVGSSLGMMLAVTAVFLIATGTASPFQRLASVIDPKDPNHAGVTSRLQVWGVALRTWRAFPFWGTGLGSFPAATAPFYDDHDQFGNTYFSHAESDYLQMLTEGGVVGAALTVLALAAIARLAGRARNAANTPPERALVLGAMAGGLALLLQCLSDFPLHIPGVAITGVILTAHLCRLGLEANEQGQPAAAESRPARIGPLACGLAMVGLGGIICLEGVRLARAEALVRSVGLPFPGSQMPTVDVQRASNDELKRVRTALEAALRQRPDWAEGHLWLGSVMLGLYSNLAAEWIGEHQEEKDAETTAVLSNPLWLHGVVHSSSAEELAEDGGLLGHEPIRDDLVPATRCFLEARRCSPDLAVTHARLATLDYLVERGESTSEHAARALRSTGYDHAVLLLAGQAAAQAGDLNLAARCWRKALSIHGEVWTEIATAAASLMSPEQVLEQVLPPGGRYPLLFAEELYSDPESRDARVMFLKAALRRLPDDTTLSPVERLWLESQARARLDERDQARALMARALTAEPNHPDWREEYINRLLEWGDVEEASRQARIGRTLHPDHPGIQRAADLALEAFARGRPQPAGPN
jgi:O-antigen ligase/tetratricopeptide (TPR) repeat protein